MRQYLHNNAHTPLRNHGLQVVKKAGKKLFLLLVLLVIIPQLASATHFRFGMITATRLSETSTTVTYNLNVSLSWRLGTSPSAIPFTISGGNTGSVTISMTTVTDPTGTYDNSTGTTTVTLNKSSTLTKIEFTGFTKLATTMNNASTNWDVYTIVNTNAPGSGPVSTLPAVINMPVGATATTFSVPATDPDAGSTLTYGEPSFTGPLAGETEPSGFSINSTTGEMTMNTVGKTAGDMYNALVTVTDNDGNQILLDFLINMVSASAPPQFDYSVTPPDGTVYNITVGQNITFPIQATNAGTGTTVDMSISGLPSYITTSNFTPIFPATGNPCTTTFSWTPTSSQLGNTIILNFIAINNIGVETSSSITINIVSEPAPVFMSATPGEGTIRSVLAGAAMSDSINAQSPIGSDVSIAFGFTPSGSSTSPAIPTAGANPGQTVFNWTPASSDFGQHYLTFEAAIASSSSIYTTRHYDIIVDDLPVFSSTPVTTAAGCSAYTYSVVATDANIPYGDSVDIVQDGPLPTWLTLTPTGNGKAVLSGTPANTDAGTYTIVLGAEDLYHHNYARVEQTFTVVVTANTIGGTPSVCMGAVTSLTDVVPGGAWSSSNANATIDATGAVTGVTAGTSIVTYMLAGCVTTISTTVNALPTVPGISGSTTVCAGSTASLTNSVTGGVWSSGNASVATIGSSSGAYTGIISGTANISYTVTDAAGCVNGTSSAITVNPVFAITSSAGANGTITPSGAANVCLGSGASYTITANAGYHISDVSVDGSSVGAVGSYSFTGVNASHTINATFATNCIPPVISCAGNIAQNTDAGACNTVVTYSAATATGTSPTITYSQNSGTAFTTGVTTVTATAINGCGTDNCSFTVTVTDNQNPTITAPAGVTVSACSAVAVSLGTPITGDNCGVASVTNNAPALFPVGTTTVTWTVADAHGNTATATQAVIVSGTAPAVTGSVTNVSCYGLANGGISTSVSGGTTPYAYSWSTGATTSAISGKVAGSYSVAVTDAHGCTGNGSYTISQPAALSLAGAVAVNVSCHGAGNGSITTNVTGGTSTYSYKWNTGSTSANLTSLSPATYSVTVTDAKGCTTSGSFTITQPASAITLSTSKTNALCYGATGIVTTSLTGGTTPYAYLWSNGATSANLTAVAGTYSLTVTDAGGCKVTGGAYTITQPSTPFVFSPSIDNVNCNGGHDGHIVAYTSGGVSPVTYSWITGGKGTTSGKDLSNAPAGSYTVTATDKNGCSITAVYTVTEPAALSLSAITTNVSCHGNNDGNINTTVTGGALPYNYYWSNGSHAADPKGLSAGTYKVTVTDANGCTISGSYTITQPSALTVSIGVSPMYTVPGQAPYTIYSYYGTQSVNLSATAAGGTGAYSYNWTPVTCVTATYTAAPSGTTNYIVTVTDATGCTAKSTQTITVKNIRCDDNCSYDDDYGDNGSHCSGKDAKGNAHSYKDNDRNKKVCICHNGKTISIDTNAVAAHLAHGDYLGACGDNGDGHCNDGGGNCNGGGGNCNGGNGNCGNGGGDGGDHHCGNKTSNPADSGAIAADAFDVVRIFPNPTSGTFSVAIPVANKVAEVQISDMDGKIIETKVISDNTGDPVQFSLGSLTHGLYFVKVTVGDKISVEKLIKK